MAVKAKPAAKAPAATTAADKAATATTGTSTTTTAVKTAVRLATVPGIDYFDSYIGRTLPGGKSDHEVMQYCRTEKLNLLIEGPTGPGKTSAVMAFAAKEKRAFYAIPSNIGIEPSQLFGKFIPDTTGGFKWVDGPVTDIVRNGGVLLINEVNFIPERVATVLFGLLDKRRQINLLDHEAETIDAHDDLLIVADMNPDYEGTRPLNKAFRNRFAVQLWWDYDDKVEAKLVRSPALRDMAKRIRKEQAAGTYETPCSTNMLIEFEKIGTAMGYEFAKSNFVNHFATDERQSIAVVVDTFKANLLADLTPKDSKAAPKDDKGTQAAGTDSDDDSTRPPLADVNDDQKFLGASAEPWIWDDERAHLLYITKDNGTGLYQMIDTEWGTFGVDWVYPTV